MENLSHDSQNSGYEPKKLRRELNLAEFIFQLNLTETKFLKTYQQNQEYINKTGKESYVQKNKRTDLLPQNERQNQSPYSLSAVQFTFVWFNSNWMNYNELKAIYLLSKYPHLSEELRGILVITFMEKQEMLEKQLERAYFHKAELEGRLRDRTNAWTEVYTEYDSNDSLITKLEKQVFGLHALVTCSTEEYYKELLMLIGEEQFTKNINKRFFQVIHPNRKKPKEEKRIGVGYKDHGLLSEESNSKILLELSGHDLKIPVLDYINPVQQYVLEQEDAILSLIALEKRAREKGLHL